MSAANAEPVVALHGVSLERDDIEVLEGITQDRIAAGADYVTIMRDTNLPNLRTALACT